MSYYIDANGDLIPYQKTGEKVVVSSVIGNYTDSDNVLTSPITLHSKTVDSSEMNETEGKLFKLQSLIVYSINFT